jgi:mRNA interferase YafQ
VSYPLLRSSAFVRNARKLVKKKPELAADIQETLTALSNDPFQPHLRTHKLKGELKDSYACSAGYDLRIIFKIGTVRTATGHPFGSHWFS